MTKISGLAELPPDVLEALVSRIESAGLPVERRPPRGLPHDYLCEGVCLYRGSLLWDYERANLDALCHEAGHVLQIRPEDRTAWEHADTATDESLAMAVQVELQRDIPGLGAESAVAMMERIGYWDGVGHDGQDWLASAEYRRDREEAMRLIYGEKREDHHGQ